MKEHDLLQTIKREGKFGGVGDGSEMSRGGEKKWVREKEKDNGIEDVSGRGRRESFFLSF